MKKSKKINHKQILIECKSVPRSGLHFLKNTLDHYLGDHFSFCERYNEPGCCKKSPCALSCFLTDAEKNEKPHLRLAKSHDFSMKDKRFKTSQHKRLLILKRDPLYAITSWFELEEIVRHKELLLKHGIDPKKILYLHEKPLVHRAIQLMDKNYMPPSNNEFLKWLNQSTRYLKAFHEKWVDAPKDPFTKIVDYSRVEVIASQLIKETMPQLKSSRALNKLSKTFMARTDPFEVTSKAVTLFLQSKKPLILTHLKKKALMR